MNFTSQPSRYGECNFILAQITLPYYIKKAAVMGIYTANEY